MSPDHDFQSAIQHHQAGRLHEAEFAYRQLVVADPAHADAWQRLGILLHQTDRTPEAVEALTQAATLKPSAADVQSNLGAVLAAAGRWSQALDSFNRALKLGANFPETHNNLGNVLRELGEIPEAIAAYRAAVRLRPIYPDAWHSLGILLRAINDLDAAGDAFTRAVQQRPNWPEALNNLAGVFQDTRRVDQAIALLRQAIALNNNPRIWDNFLLALHGQDGITPQSLRDEHARWNAACALPLVRPPHPQDNNLSPNRRLRIGYVSPDFREHPVGRLFLPVLVNHDRSRFEIVCYSDVRRPDSITDRLRLGADQWIDATSLTDDALAQRIRHDRIDVLVDLTLHAANNRLLVFAQKPAPVQITWAGYPGSTGLTTIDFRLSDPHLDPPAENRDPFYSEKTVLLPNCFWCFDPQTPEPLVNDLPAARNGFITFGCLNQFGKITDATLNRWATLLNRLPNSHFHLLAPASRARAELTKHLEITGVQPARITFADRQPRPDYLRLYHQIDICLDTFPYTGHTTTIDALWMGVPVVTLADQTPVSRGGLSILSQLGLTHCIAHTDQTFTQIAINFASDLSQLANLRSTIRSRLMASPIANTTQFTRDLEAAVYSAWQTCAS
jgi:protein O-GlcNAc transferase